jgi:hypothetical protein
LHRLNLVRAHLIAFYLAQSTLKEFPYSLN